VKSCRCYCCNALLDAFTADNTTSPPRCSACVEEQRRAAEREQKRRT
jgi:hypothetical protein